MGQIKIVNNCRTLLRAYQNGLLGQTRMPEDSNPGFSDNQLEERLFYFTLPMALNYQRDSYKLWQSALASYQDPAIKSIFSVKNSVIISEESLRRKLMKHKLALQPQKHITTWGTIARSIYQNWGSLVNLFYSIDDDFLKLKNLIQVDFKKDFPYLSGPKIFNYWSFVMINYGRVKMRNKHFIDIAPDTHITKCSIKLGVITQEEAQAFSKEQISQRWREALQNSGIDPIDMHSPLWFWSRNGFLYSLPKIIKD
ncbi:MAG: hypothetical protein PHN39_01830 [Candidatus Pacebacteria bacterium]|nr:hypothetical protein [Candidatus Paceibacterota bacterium]